MPSCGSQLVVFAGQGSGCCGSLVKGCTVYCTTLNLLEHLLNLSWNNACACEHSRKPCEVGRNNLNHRNGRNQVGTNLETSLCMEELGDGFRVFFWVVLFWMLFDPFLRNLM